MNPSKKPFHLSFYSYDSLGNPWVGGGGAVRDFEVLRRLVPHARVTLTVGRYPGFKPGLHDGVEVRGLGLGLLNNWVGRVTYALAANLRILFDRADVIGNSVSIYSPIITELFLRRRTYLFMHHYVGVGSLKKGPFGFISFLIERLFMRFGRTFFVVNATVRERISSLNPEARIELTTNGFDPALLNLVSKVPTPPFILFVGRFDIYMKGLDLLIPAYLETAASKGVDLVLAGRASEKDAREIQDLIPESMRNRIRLELNISATRKAELLSSCLFFCSPSRFEGFGIAALEANAAGKAVLATDTDGFRDSLALGETALAVPPENPTALKSAMIRLMDDKALREKLGREGRKRAGTFSWDVIAEQEWKWIEGMGIRQ